jgi:hypothetical protein
MSMLQTADDNAGGHVCLHIPSIRQDILTSPPAATSPPHHVPCWCQWGPAQREQAVAQDNLVLVIAVPRLPHPI